MTLFPINFHFGDFVMPWGKKPYVLVVEDDDLTIGLIRWAAEHEGIEIKVAKSGEEAIGVLHETGRKPSFVLADVGLSGMNGWALRDMICVTWPGIRVCVMSGSLERLNKMPVGESVCILLKGPSFSTFFRDSKKWGKV